MFLRVLGLLQVLGERGSNPGGSPGPDLGVRCPVYKPGLHRHGLHIYHPQQLPRTLHLHFPLPHE